MSNIGIRKIEIVPNMQDDAYDVTITYCPDDCVFTLTDEYSVSVHKAVEYCLSATKNFNSLYISALERALQLFNWGVLADHGRKDFEEW